MSAVANGKLEAYTQEASKDLAFVVKDRWITTAEASQILNIAPQTLAVWRMLGKNVPFAKRGRLVRYKLRDVLAFLEGGMVPVTAESSNS